MHIRKAILSDAGSVRDLETKVWLDEVTSAWDIGTFVRCGYVYVACLDSSIVGAIVAIQHRCAYLYVVGLLVEPTMRRKGIGERLYKRVLHHAHRVSSGRVETHVGISSGASVALHKKLGFRVIRQETDVYGLQEKDEARLLMRYG